MEETQAKIIEIDPEVLNPHVLEPEALETEAIETEAIEPGPLDEEQMDGLSDEGSETNESNQGSDYGTDEESLNEPQVTGLEANTQGELPAEYEYDNDDDDSVDFGDYLQKINQDYRQNIIETAHTEEFHINHDEMTKLCITKRDEHGRIIDPLHKTTPILSKYEFTKLIGLRCKQLSDGAQPLIEIPPELMNNVVIAELELRQKVLPFVIKRPLPHGACEYWRVRDLELI